jgi:hypothetical protein
MQLFIVSKPGEAPAPADRVEARKIAGLVQPVFSLCPQGR